MNKTVITFYVKTKGNVIQQVGRSCVEQPVTIADQREKKVRRVAV